MALEREFEVLIAEFSRKRIAIAFLLPALVFYLIFYSSLLLLVNFPLDYSLGSYKAKISFSDILYIQYFLIFFFTVILFCFYVERKVSSFTAKTVYFDYSVNFSIYVFLGIIGFFASLLSNLISLPILVDNIVNHLAILSLVTISYGLVFRNSLVGDSQKKISTALITLNLISFVGVPFFLGYINKLILLLATIIFSACFIRKKKKIFFFSIFLLIFALLMQLVKGPYRDFLFHGPFQKVGLNSDLNPTKPDDLGCNTGYLGVSLTSPPLADIGHNKSSLDMVETGYAKVDFQVANRMVSDRYSLKELYEIPENFKKISTEMISAGNYIIPLSMARAWGEGVISRDGTRAARLLSSFDQALPTVSKGLYGLLLIDGNGVKIDQPQGVHCVFLSKDESLLRYLVEHENQVVHQLVDQELYAIQDKTELKRLKKVIGEQRRENATKLKLAILASKHPPELNKNLKKQFRYLDNSSGYLISSAVDRVDQARNVVLINQLISKDRIHSFGLRVYKEIGQAFIPRLFWPSKPINKDAIGIAIGKQLGLYSEKNPTMSWALPLIPESLLISGFFGLVLSSLGLSICYAIYYHQALKNNFYLFLFGNYAVANITMSLFTGFGVIGGMIQSLLLLQGILILINFYRFMRLRIIS